MKAEEKANSWRHVAAYTCERWWRILMWGKECSTVSSRLDAYSYIFQQIGHPLPEASIHYD